MKIVMQCVLCPLYVLTIVKEGFSCVLIYQNVMVTCAFFVLHFLSNVEHDRKRSVTLLN